MINDEQIVQFRARKLIARDGARAAQAAADELNHSIDHQNWYERDLWARVVRAIHERLRIAQRTESSE